MYCSTLLALVAMLCFQDPVETGRSVTEASKTTGSSVTDSPPTDGPSDVASDSADLVTLEFRDQEWLPALRWLAGKRKLNLDWQSLPEDQVSLSCMQPLPLDEAEDLFNMQLLARGFALVKRAGVLRVVSLKDLDVTLVPRVEPEELETLQKHSLVRVSFSLDWMIAEEAAKELAPLLSPYGKLFPMASANRLEAVDAVVNLREFHRLLSQAENDDTRRERVAEFHLQHRRAEEVAPKVRQLLGLPNDAGITSSGQTQLDIEQARFKAEAVKQMGRDAQALVTEKKPTVFLVVNEKENSLLVNAPPNKIEIVRQAVLAMDKELPARGSTWETLSRVKVYDVYGFDPEVVTKMVTSLQERESIAKDSRVYHEAAYNRLIAFASPADHLTLSQVIDSFRAEKRSASVLSLSNLDPVYASKAIQAVLKTPERPSSAPGVPSDGKFQVEADPEHSRLLLWATPKEGKDVREFLAELGESYSETSVDSKVQVIETHGQNVDSAIERLKKVWEDLSDSPLILEPPVEPKRFPIENPINRSDKDNSLNGTDASFQGVELASARMVALHSEFPSEGSSESGSPPVRLMRASDGNIIVLSRDPNAAETAKRLLKQLLKPPAQLKVFALKHAQASVVKRQLETLLVPAATTVPSLKLVTTPALMIDIDPRTNRLMVQNASERQLEQIQESVQLLDQPNAEDEKLQREKVTLRLKNRRASVVAEALRTVYQDLMIVNDRALTRSTGFSRSMAAASINPEYQGLLSIGVDAEANLLIISAPKYLVQDVLELAESMDKPTDGNAIAIVPFQTQVTGSESKDLRVQESIRRILGERKK
ncbi:MAG: secretin N-terminal domain-containing protein [Planctomycetota bacterium]